MIERKQNLRAKMKLHKIEVRATSDIDGLAEHLTNCKKENQDDDGTILCFLCPQEIDYLVGLIRKNALSEKHKKTLLKQMLIQQRHHKEEDNIEAFNSVGYLASLVK